jgi:hypothetical protein
MAREVATRCSKRLPRVAAIGLHALLPRRTRGRKKRGGERSAAEAREKRRTQKRRTQKKSMQKEDGARMVGGR